MTDLPPPSEEDTPTQRLQLVLAIVFLVIMVGAVVDLILDRPTTLLSVHVLFEVGMVLVSLSAAAWLASGWYAALRDVRALRDVVAAHQAERNAWRDRAGQLLRSLSDAIDAQFAAWGLTPAERETALLLLKGYSHKRIGKMTGRSERTVRQHAVAVYRKSGLAGRSELSGFFLEGLVLPPESRGDHTFHQVETANRSV